MHTWIYRTRATLALPSHLAPSTWPLPTRTNFESSAARVTWCRAKRVEATCSGMALDAGTDVHTDYLLNLPQLTITCSDFHTVADKISILRFGIVTWWKSTSPFCLSEISFLFLIIPLRTWRVSYSFNSSFLILFCWLIILLSFFVEVWSLLLHRDQRVGLKQPALPHFRHTGVNDGSWLAGTEGTGWHPRVVMSKLCPKRIV